MTFQKVFFKKTKTPGGGACISFIVKLPKHFALLQQSLRYVSKQLEPEWVYLGCLQQPTLSTKLSRASHIRRFGSVTQKDIQCHLPPVFWPFLVDPFERSVHEFSASLEMWLAFYWSPKLHFKNSNSCKIFKKNLDLRLQSAIF